MSCSAASACIAVRYESVARCGADGETPQRSRFPGRAMPPRDEVPISVDDRVSGGWSIGDETGEHVRLEQVGEVREPLVLGQLGLVDRHRRADAEVAVGAHHRVHCLRSRSRSVDRIIEHGGDTATDHLERSEEHASAVELRRERAEVERRQLVEHEQLEREVVDEAAVERAGGMDVGVDEPRQREPPVGVEHRDGLVQRGASCVDDLRDHAVAHHDVDGGTEARRAVFVEQHRRADQARSAHHVLP